MMTQVYSPDLEPSDSLTATRFTIGDFDVSSISTEDNLCRRGKEY